MELNKTNKRLIAAGRPFSVAIIKNDPRITKQNGKQSSYNIVGKNGSGVAEFGCDELAALWFCEAANRYADEIYSRRSTKAVNSGDAAKLHEALTKVKEWMEHRIATCGFEASATFPTMLEDVVLPALSNPPRNCGVGTTEE